MHRLRSPLTFLLFAACATAGASHAQQISLLTRSPGCVSDDGHVLSAQTTDHLNAVCADLARQTHTQLVVLTLENTDEIPIALYAQGVLHAWNIGAPDKGRGVLLVVSIGGRKWSIVTTRSLTPPLPPARIHAIEQQMLVYLRVSQNDQAMTLGTQEIAAQVAQDSGAVLRVPLEAIPSVDRRPHLLGRKQAAVVAVVLLLLLLLFWRTGTLHRALPILFSKSYRSRSERPR